MPVVLVRDLPDPIRAALASLGFGSKDVSVSVAAKVSPFGLTGDGRRAFFVAVNLTTGETSVRRGSWGGANMFVRGNVVDECTESFPIPRDVAVIQGHEGAGPVRASVVLSPDNIVPGLLPAKPDLSDDESTVLAVMRGLISSARKPYLATRTAAVDALVSRGFIRRAANGSLALTTAGKNAAEGIRLP